MDGFILSTMFLLFAFRLGSLVLKRFEYWFPVFGAIRSGLKKVLLLCWRKDNKTTGAKQHKQKINYHKQP